MRNKVLEFQKTGGETMEGTLEVHQLKVKLLREEFEELKEALYENDMVEVLDAVIDFKYVLLERLKFGKKE